MGPRFREDDDKRNLCNLVRGLGNLEALAVHAAGQCFVLLGAEFGAEGRVDDVLFLTDMMLDVGLEFGEAGELGERGLVNVLKVIQTLLDLGIMLLAELVGGLSFTRGAEGEVDRVLLLDGVLTEGVLRRQQQRSALLRLRITGLFHSFHDASGHLVLSLQSVEPVTLGSSDGLDGSLASR